MLINIFKKKQQELPPEIIGIAEAIRMDRERRKIKQPIYKPSIKVNAY